MSNKSTTSELSTTDLQLLSFLDDTTDSDQIILNNNSMAKWNPSVKLEHMSSALYGHSEKNNSGESEESDSSFAIEDLKDSSVYWNPIVKLEPLPFTFSNNDDNDKRLDRIKTSKTTNAIRKSEVQASPSIGGTSSAKGKSEVLASRSTGGTSKEPQAIPHRRIETNSTNAIRKSEVQASTSTGGISKEPEEIPHQRIETNSTKIDTISKNPKRIRNAKRKWSHKSTHVKKPKVESKEHQCIICWDTENGQEWGSEDMDMRYLVCFHKFHRICIENWFWRTGEERCPLCQCDQTPNLSLV